jgi:hypothetical protein
VTFFTPELLELESVLEVEEEDEDLLTELRLTLLLLEFPLPVDPLDTVLELVEDSLAVELLCSCLADCDSLLLGELFGLPPDVIDIDIDPDAGEGVRARACGLDTAFSVPSHT